MYPSAGRALHTLGRKFCIAPLGTPSWYIVGLACTPLPISLKPMGGKPSHLGHKTLGEKVCYCQSLPLNFVLLGASYSVYWRVQSLQDIQDGVKFIWIHRCSILICHPFDSCKRGYVVLGLSTPVRVGQDSTETLGISICGGSALLLRYSVGAIVSCILIKQTITMVLPF